MRNRLTLMLVLASGLLIAVFFALRPRATDEALPMIAAKLRVDPNTVTLQRFYLNDLGDHCIFFRVESVPESTVRKIRQTPSEYFDRSSYNPLSVLIPFRGENTDQLKDKNWWKPALSPREGEQWVTIWGKHYRTILILREGVLYGYMEDSYNRQATPGPF